MYCYEQKTPLKFIYEMHWYNRRWDQKRKEIFNNESKFKLPRSEKKKTLIDI